MTKKDTIQEKLQKAVDNFQPCTQESDTIIFDCRGCDISEATYQGDIFNHRAVACLLLNNIKIVIETGATYTRRTKHATTGATLKHPKIIYDNNGLIIHFSVEDLPTFEHDYFSGYRLVNNSFHVNDEWIRDDLQTSAHRVKVLLRFINAELKTHFKKAIFINRGNDSVKTISEAMKDHYIRDFDKMPMTAAEEIKLTTQAKQRWESLQYCGIIPQSENFTDHAVFISSSSLHGFYFPNLQNCAVRCFAFGVYGRVVVCIDDEE